LQLQAAIFSCCFKQNNFEVLMTAALTLSPKAQFLANDGTPLVGGKLYTYAAGTTTPLATYTAYAGTVANTNPVILDSRGEADVWLDNALYKLALYDSDNALIWTVDNISSVNNGIFTGPVSGTTGTFSGALTAASGTFSGALTAASGMTAASGTFSGAVSGTTGTFSGAVSGTTGTFSGAVSGTTGTFSGAVSGTTGTFSDNVQMASANGSCLAGLRNRVINGNFYNDQRNAGASQTITAAAALAYTVDRFYAYCTGANVTGQRVAGTAPNAYLYRFTGAASVTKIGFAQRIENLNCQDLAGNTATLSVDLSNSLLTTVSWTAYYATTANTFGTLASPTRTQIATGTFTVTSTLTRYSTNITIPSAATTGIEIELSVAAQTSGTWNIGNVQLEFGSVATPFEQIPIGLSLQLCQRYYYRLNSPTNTSILSPGYFVSSTQFTGATSFPVQMRTSPSALDQSGTATDYRINYTANTVCNAVPTFNSATNTNYGFTLFSIASGGTGGVGGAAIAATTNAYLGWSAEL
jgi:hypothetical protein